MPAIFPVYAAPPHPAHETGAMTKQLDASAAGKDHYLILNGLRGVAAVMAVRA
jgi:hypothetical protein